MVQILISVYVQIRNWNLNITLCFCPMSDMIQIVVIYNIVIYECFILVLVHSSWIMLISQHSRWVNDGRGQRGMMTSSQPIDWPWFLLHNSLTSPSLLPPSLCNKNKVNWSTVVTYKCSLLTTTNMDAWNMSEHNLAATVSV